MNSWLQRRGWGGFIVMLLGCVALGLVYVVSVCAQEKTDSGSSAAAALFGPPPSVGKAAPDPAVRCDQLESAVILLSNRLGRMVQQPTENNSVEKRLANLEQRVTQLERQMDALQRRVQRVELKK